VSTGFSGSSGERPPLSPAESRERWARVQEVFAAAIECDRNALNDVLTRECGDNLEVRRDVESLLDAHYGSGLVDRLAGDLAPAI